MYHYVYRITNKKERKHYYGSRSSSLQPHEDLGIKYFSSSSDKSFIKDQKKNNDDFKYKVIKIFETREEALQYEIKLHKKFNVSRNKSFYNKSNQLTSGFSTFGNKEMGKKTSTGLKKFWKNTTEEYKKHHSECAKRHWSEMSLEKREEISKKISESLKGKKEPIWKREQHSKRMSGKGNSNAKIIEIFNQRGEKEFSCEGNFKEICKQNNLPFISLQRSYSDNGTPIYNTKRGKTEAKKRGNEKFIGWYALKVN